MANTKEGKIFEEDWKNSFINKNIYIVRLKDNPIGWINQNNRINNVGFSTNNPYDFFGFSKGHLLCMENKSTQYVSIGFDRNENDKKQIKLHQINGLLEARKHKDVFAGFVFEFRKYNVVYYLDIARFYIFWSKTDKHSINIDDVIELGGIKIDREKLRTRYRYDIEKLMVDIIEEDNLRMSKTDHKND